MGVGDVFFMARPPRDVVCAAREMLERHGLDAMLDRALFPPANWHQSISDLQPGSRETCARMLRAGARVRAPAFDLVLDRVCSRHDQPGTIHWYLRAREIKPSGLEALVDSVRAETKAEGIGPQGGHTAHVTISYKAAVGLPRVLKIPPIVWPVDAFELVECRDQPYRYEVIGRWSLLPVTGPRRGQTDLFGA